MGLEALSYADHGRPGAVRRVGAGALDPSTRADAKMAPQTLLFSLFVNTQCGDGDNCTDIVQ
jgi:hypothetical protein